MAARVLATAPPRFALAGISMGGYVALEILSQAPERVERLALLDTQAAPDDEEMRMRRRGLLELAEKGSFKGVTERLLPLILHPDNVTDPALAGLVMAMAERVGREGFRRQQSAILNRPDFRPLLPSIRQPTLVLHGVADRLTPPAGHRDMAIAIQTARLVAVAGAGHLPPLERPKETTTALRQWLAA